MKKLSLIIAAVFIFGVGNVVRADDDGTDKHSVTVDVPTFAILDIESTGSDNSIDLEPSVVGLEAGSEVKWSSVSNSELWLNYTAIADNKGNGSSPVAQTREISVSMDKVFPGLNIKLKVAADAGNGGGNPGSSTYTESELLLTTSSQKIIGGIETCYTGNGSGSGHQLTYSLNANDYSSLLAGSKTITVTYTITDETSGGGSN